ncbi:MAG: uncharacterized protein A8A55_2802 [Amphiamblys sp. WSBS2006]|nr:MAG: uncharacterized protein A8A55_2802 [Amphiamblys sp. WSBS2006]
MCREMHFVLCRECLKYLKGRTDKKEVVCPYCKKKKSDKAYQKEILGVLFSFMPHQTLRSPELRPDTKVKTVTKLTRETKVVLSNITIASSLFFELLAKAAVEVRNRVSLVENDDSLGWCIWELDWGTGGRTKISVYGCNKEETKWVCANTKTEENRALSPWKIRRDEKNVRDFLGCWAGVIGNNRYYISLELSNEDSTKEILGEGNSSL